MRWDELKVDAAEQPLPGLERALKVRHFDAPEALGISFHEVEARSVLNRVPGGSYGFNWTVNPYRGCTHACAYCFARPTHTYLGWDVGRDFERQIVVKVNAPERLRAELARPSWGRELVALGTNTDPYQWVEGRYRLMPGILEALEEAETPVSVLTKSPLVLRDIGIFERMAAKLPVSVNLSVPTLDEQVWRQTEPHTPNPRARLEAVAELRRRGIESGVMIAPLMPGINDDPARVEPIQDLAREAGASFVTGVALHLRGEVKEVFFAWLREKRPDLLPRYERLFPGRRPQMPASERRRTTRAVRPWGRNRRRNAAGEAPSPTSSPGSSSRPRGAAGPEAPPGQPRLF